MTPIADNETFRAAIQALPCEAQHRLAALFTRRVLPLTGDERIARVVETALKEDATPEELEAAHRMARAAIVDSHCRCGSECDWREQAAYFVARAAAAAVAPEKMCLSEGSAWQAALNARMARTCAAIDDGEVSPEEESREQFRIASEFLNR